ncbi:unnamed protein product [Strongylus vulgaris]|uniref:Lipid-binding serum glycoprotein C-terminal domain-containing protein n=1 Tax=Strongylus vulgaris TaxID=40348 RepID=A0A3P7J2F7_STRVU|nr:unnamed protein product [Strongylus vulgaris]
MAKVSNCIILRINEIGLQEAANFTREWLSMAGPNLIVPDIKQTFVSSFAAGELVIKNITVNHFVPPHIRFHPSGNNSIYMTTHSGYAQVLADWQVKSEVLNVLRFPLQGDNTSPNMVENTSPNMVEVSHCVARIRDLRINVQGGVAAEVIQWFKSSVTSVIRRKLEEIYCAVMEQAWIPWVEAQISQFSPNLTLSSNPESLESIYFAKMNVDLRMRSNLIWNGELLEGESVKNQSDYDNVAYSTSNRMITVLIEEETVQSTLAATHFSGHFVATVDSPFLHTYCDILCIGTVLPEIAEAMPNSSFTVQASTLNPPVISLQEGKALVFVNASLDFHVGFELLLTTAIHLITRVSRSKSMQVRCTSSMLNAQAKLMDSKIGTMSQKTIDLLVDISTPFLEDAVDLLVSRGVPVTRLFQFPSTNELLTIQEKYIKLEADIDFPTVLQYSAAVHL